VAPVGPYGLDECVFGALRAGASGFLLKDVAPADLLRAVTVVARAARRCWPRWSSAR
jgi:DNA-binding NarL/FixJ family response regulator